jgi:Fe-S oxidoreductase
MTVEGIDADLVRAADSRRGPHRRPRLPDGAAWLLVEVGGADPDQGRDRAAGVVAAAAGATGSAVLTDVAAQRAVWSVRERGAGLATRTAEGAEAWPGWEDAAVPPDRLAGYLEDFHALMADHGRHGVVYGHFAEGCVHVRVDHDLLTDRGRAAYRRFCEDAADLVVAHGGSLSGEHGDGRARSELLARMYSPEALAAFAAFKHVFDPDDLFNPGVLVDPVPLDADLRLALHGRDVPVDLAFAYAEDDGELGKAVRRCVGVGACRRQSGGGMCPSYRATLDERHSTRGRARLLYEMLEGSLADDGWRSPDVHEALDLCLACKACASECPVSVDMATYKAEFLHQYYRRRLRPRSHYVLGWLPVWLRLGRRTPGMANRVLATWLAARVGGLDPDRALPRLVSRRAERPPRHGGSGGDPVTLWLDTFTASFDPQTAVDAHRLLVAAGHDVTVAGPDVCCGLTWVTTGQLGRAARVMRSTVTALDAGPGPVVVLEPSCAATLRVDLPGLLGTAAATRVAERVRTLAEVLLAAELPLAPLSEELVAQFHCHQRAVLGTTADVELLARLGAFVTSVEEGCCGLAGSFGMEAGHAEVSRTCAEQSFLPVLAAHPDARVLADGFSCRVQVEQLSGRRAVPLARLLATQLRAAR